MVLPTLISPSFSPPQPVSIGLFSISTSPLLLCEQINLYCGIIDKIIQLEERGSDF